MSDQGSDRSWNSLPQGVLQAISSAAAWSDCLTLRLVCKLWSAAVEPLIRHIRVHVASGCNNTAVGGAAPGQLLQQALMRLQCVASIELVLTTHTTGLQLADVLKIVGMQEQIREVHVWEVPAVQSLARPRDYASSLQLSALRHISVLSIRSSVTWSLQDIWDQICCTSGARVLPALDSLTITQVLSNRQQQVCRLFLDAPEYPNLNNSSDDSDPAVVLAVLPNLKHLVTPLPGQKDPQGAICCTISASHDSYLKGLAAGAPNLHTLRILNSFQGNTEVLQSFSSLVELHVCVGGLLRSLVDLMEEESSITKPLMNMRQLQNLDLTGAEGMKVPVKLEWLTATPQLQHLTACILQSSEDVYKVKPDQLQSLCALHVSKSPEVLAQIAAVGRNLTALTLSTAGPGVFSIREPFSFRRNSISLQPYLTAYSNLHSLAILSGEEHLAYTVQNPAEIWKAMPSLSCLRLQGVGLGYNRQGEPLHDRHISDIVSGCSPHDCQDEKMAWARIADKAHSLVTLWMQDLPKGLQQLQLSRYLLVLSGSDLQPSGFAMHSLVLADCMAIVADKDLGRVMDIKVGQNISWTEGPLQGSVLAVALPLHPAVVASSQVDSDAVVAAFCTSQNEAQQQQQQPASANIDVTQNPRLDEDTVQGPAVEARGLHVAIRKAVWQLLAQQQVHQLQDLQLLHISTDGGAATLAGSYQQLQRLCIRAASWDNVTQQERAWTAAVSVRNLAAAGLAGRLQHLTQLELDFGRFASPVAHYRYEQGSRKLYDGCGIGALRLLSSSLKSLKSLKITLDLAHCSLSACAKGCAETCNPFIDSTSTAGTGDRHYDCIAFDACSNDASMVLSSKLQLPLCCCGGAWILSNWAQLRVLDVTILVPSLQVLGDFGPGVVGCCHGCGGGLGLEAVRWFMKHSVQEALPACEVLYKEESSHA